MTSSGAYDPLFLPVHAYIDYLFTQWQERNPEIQVEKIFFLKIAFTFLNNDVQSIGVTDAILFCLLIMRLCFP